MKMIKKILSLARYALSRVARDSRLAHHSRFGVGGFTRYILLSIFLLPAASAWAGDLTVDNLTVSTNAVIYGNLNFSTGDGGTSNGATATGGTITTVGGYRIHTFTSSGTFEVNGGSLACEVVVVAGGGGGGWGYSSGGGGGGGLVYQTSRSVSGINTVVVGTGGAIGYNTGEGAARSTRTGGSGSNSVFDTITAVGGGGGAGGGWYGRPGGSGGGGTYDNTNGYSTQTDSGGGTGYGHAGGLGGAGPDSSGGGGGAGEVGESMSAAKCGDGGDGTNVFNNSYYAGGGGGGAFHNEGGNGGLGGGGHGGTKTNLTPGTAGAPNTGGGGGGSGNTTTALGDAGGSGIVIVRYPFTSSSNNVSTTLTISSNGISQVSTSAANIFMGKVGIGTNNPAEKLHVAGNVQVDGSIKFGNETRTNWPDVAVGALISSNNLSDVADPATARANLGLGSAATNDAGVFMTLTGDGSQLTNITAAQVGAVSTNAGALLAANNLSDVDNTGTARSNLGLGSAATNENSAFLSPSGNGSQLTGITAAQTGALSTNGGTMNGELTILNPSGDIPMGVYTNQ